MTENYSLKRKKGFVKAEVYGLFGSRGIDTVTVEACGKTLDVKVKSTDSETLINHNNGQIKKQAYLYVKKELLCTN
jgi:hypothetical protein